MDFTHVSIASNLFSTRLIFTEPGTPNGTTRQSTTVGVGVMLDATTTRWALRLLGIVYPGYLTYKTLEHDRKRGENQRGWCIYWAVASAWLGCVAPVLDVVFDGRVALYGESKVRAKCVRA